MLSLVVDDSFPTFKEMDKIKNNKTPTTGA